MACVKFLLLVILLPTAAYGESLRVTATLVELLGLHDQLEAYRFRTGAYPESLDDLGVSGRFIDAWGQPYVYRRDEVRVTLYSVGQNGADERGEGDDVVSWELLKREFYPELGPQHAVLWTILVAIAVSSAGGVWFYAHRKRVAA